MISPLTAIISMAMTQDHPEGLEGRLLAGRMAGAAGIEPATYGFGDRRSTS